MKSVDGKSQPVFGGKFFLFLWDSVWTKHRVVEIGLLLKKSKQGGTVVKDIYIEFPEVFKKVHVEFSGVM